MKKKKVIKSNQLIVLMVCAALVAVGLVMLFFSLFAIYKAYEVDMTVFVSNASGFNTDTDMLNFGKAAPGNANSRMMVMSHDYKKPLLVSFRKSGNISGFVDLPEEFYLEPGLTKEVSINAIIPIEAQQGRYDGKLTVYFRRI